MRSMAEQALLLAVVALFGTGPRLVNSYSENRVQERQQLIERRLAAVRGVSKACAATAAWSQLVLWVEEEDKVDELEALPIREQWDLLRQVNEHYAQTVSEVDSANAVFGTSFPVKLILNNATDDWETYEEREARYKETERRCRAMVQQLSQRVYE